MNLTQLATGLTRKFEQSRIVFWHDAEQSFADVLAELTLDGVSVLNMAVHSTFEVKKRLERDEPAQKFLLYFPEAEPHPEQDWLLDIRLYSAEFYADSASLILNELGISQMSLRGYIRERNEFFKSGQRTNQLRKRITENESPESLDLKMIAVVLACEPSVSAILMSLFAELAEKAQQDVLTPDFEESELEESGRLASLGLLEAFWAQMQRQLSFSCESPSLLALLRSLFATELFMQLEGEEKRWLDNHLLKSSSARAAALAFMSEWRDSRQYSSDHDQLSAVMAEQLELGSRFQSCSLATLQEVVSFEAAEQALIRQLKAIIVDGDASQRKLDIEALITQRKQGHWCQAKSAYRSIYAALQQAHRLFTLRDSYRAGFIARDAQDLLTRYSNEWYLFDRHYRSFNEHALAVHQVGAEILRDLKEAVENLYVNWYLPELATAWEQFVTRDNLLENWHINGFTRQSDFYRSKVKQQLATTGVKRVFVVISDALRYEVAQELGESLALAKRFDTKLEPMLGVLPSYTQLGMAALLPHEKLSYQGDSGVVLADGMSTQGLENRRKVLTGKRGVALKSTELLELSNDTGRELFADAQVVYIYHNTIDAIGDKADNEHRTFEACRSAINELKHLVERLASRFNASRVLITADHGFLFRQQPMQSADRTSIKSSVQGSFEAKKRYMLGNHLMQGLEADVPVWHGKVNACLGASGDSNDPTEFLLPKGCQRFHFSGGARFIHGGLMPQEICVPLLTVLSVRGTRAEKLQKQKVSVVVAEQQIRLVNRIDQIRVIQTDPVGERFVPRTLKFMVVDADEQPVSLEEKVVFESTSDQMSERERRVKLKLTGSDYQRKASYSLVITDVDTNTELQRLSVTIDLAINDEFGF